MLKKEKRTAAILLSNHFTYRKMIRFTMSSIIMMVFTSIYGMVDGFFVSNYSGAVPFASLNLVMPFIMILSAVGFMFGTGGSALVSMTLGMGKPEEANEIFSLLTIVLAACGVILAVTILSGCANMILDWLLVGMLDFGLGGAAAATVASQVVGGMIPLVFFLLPNPTILHFLQEFLCYSPLSYLKIMKL